MGIYALIILPRLVCVAAGSGPPTGTAGTAAFLASGAIFFGGSKSPWGEGFLVSHAAPGDSGGSGCMYEIALEIRLFLCRKLLHGRHCFSLGLNV